MKPFLCAVLIFLALLNTWAGLKWQQFATGRPPILRVTDDPIPGSCQPQGMAILCYVGPTVVGSTAHDDAGHEWRRVR